MNTEDVGASADQDKDKKQLLPVNIKKNILDEVTKKACSDEHAFFMFNPLSQQAHRAQSRGPRDGCPAGIFAVHRLQMRP
jgi:hypothetical protein